MRHILRHLWLCYQWLQNTQEGAWNKACFSQQKSSFISVPKAYACTLPELIMKLVCPGFAGKANKLKTQGIYMYTCIHTTCAHI